MPSDREQALETAQRLVAQYDRRGNRLVTEELIADALLEAQAQGCEAAAEEIGGLEVTGRAFISEVQLAFVLALNHRADRLRKQKGGGK